MFSAVASAFIIDVDPQLQPDPNADTAALLRVLIYKIDKTTFGDNVPTLPQWTGPPPAMVYVQAMLFASLAASLFAAFLAILGKQWLIRYDSTDMRGSVIERSQNRQQKLDGIVAWYFDHVVGSLPLMLQAALLLLGCALSRYLWEVDITIASVVLGVTSFGSLFYLLISAAGTAFKACPYQTPGSYVLRYLGLKAHSAASGFPSLRVAGLAIRNTLMKSRVIRTIVANLRCYHPWWPVENMVPFSRDLVVAVPGALVRDAQSMLQSTTRTLVTLPTRARSVTRALHYRLYGPPLTPEQRQSQQAVALGLRCISWTLQASLEKAVRLSTLKHLMSMPELSYFDPYLVVDCFEVFVGCIHVVNHEVLTVEGLEELATVSARCLFRTFHRLSVVDPTSCVLTTLRHRYSKLLRNDEIDFTSLPFRYTMLMIHALFKRRWNPSYLKWDRPTADEQLPFARYMAEAAQMGYQHTRRTKVSRWILRFSLFSLSLDPPSPPPVIADCLTIIAMDLGCDVSDVVTPGERYVQSKFRVYRFAEREPVFKWNKYRISLLRRSIPWSGQPVQI